MNRTHHFPLAIALAALAATSFAATPDEHAGHHPAGSAPAAAAKSEPAPSAEMKRMDKQTGAMHDMHEKMMAAKTPEERRALMAEHMKTMREGMAMMKDMPASGMGMKGGKGDLAARHAMMEKHVEMMGAAMEMMADRLPAVPAPAK